MKFNTETAVVLTSNESVTIAFDDVLKILTHYITPACFTQLNKLQRDIGNQLCYAINDWTDMSVVALNGRDVDQIIVNIECLIENTGTTLADLLTTWGIKTIASGARPAEPKLSATLIGRTVLMKNPGQDYVHFRVVAGPFIHFKHPQSTALENLHNNENDRIVLLNGETPAQEVQDFTNSQVRTMFNQPVQEPVIFNNGVVHAFFRGKVIELTKDEFQTWMLKVMSPSGFVAMHRLYKEMNGFMSVRVTETEDIELCVTTTQSNTWRIDLNYL